MRYIEVVVVEYLLLFNGPAVGYVYTLVEVVLYTLDIAAYFCSYIDT